MKILIGVLIYIDLVILAVRISTKSSKKLNDLWTKRPVLYFIAAIFCTPYVLLCHLNILRCRIKIFLKTRKR